MEDRSAALMEQRTDSRAYNESELVSIKTTLNLPYYTSSADYERAYGSIEVDGITYQYVKRRVYQDTLELLCLPNVTIRDIKEAKNNIAKQAADGSTSSPLKKGGSVGKIAIPDFFNQAPLTYSVGVPEAKCTFARSFDARLAIGHLTLPDQPPRLLQCTS